MKTNADEVHGRVVAWGKLKARVDEEEGRLLLEARRAGVHEVLGMGTFESYVERVLGYDARYTRERLRVAEALEGLPSVAAALRGGELSWSAVRELTRVATAEDEGKWLAAASGKTVREIEELVAGRGARRHRLAFEVSAETFAVWREAMAAVKKNGEGLDDDSALMTIARAVLGGGDEGRSAYQIAVVVCDSCKQGFVQSKGELVAVDAAVVETARCDANDIGNVDQHDAERAAQSVPPAVRRQVVARFHGKCAVPGCRCSQYLDVHHIAPRAEGGGHDVDNLVLLCGAHHRQFHEGFLQITTHVGHLQFHHADGTPYGAAPSPQTAIDASLVVGGLRRMGYKDSESRSMVATALATHVGQDLPIERLIFESLRAGRRVTTS